MLKGLASLFVLMGLALPAHSIEPTYDLVCEGNEFTLNFVFDDEGRMKVDLTLEETRESYVGMYKEGQNYLSTLFKMESEEEVYIVNAILMYDTMKLDVTSYSEPINEIFNWESRFSCEWTQQ